MSIRFAENFTFRSLDFAFPRAATDAVFAVERDYIRKDVYIFSLSSGPMALGAGRCSTTMFRQKILVDERFADAFIADIQAACVPFNVDDSEWHGFGDDIVEVEEA